jgi:hypothetical protein
MTPRSSGLAGKPSLWAVGNENDQLQLDGAAYDPVQNRWRRIARAFDAGQRINPLVAWTGTVVLVIGGDNPDGSLPLSGASSYDPLRDTWRTLASPPNGFVTSRSPWVWIGSTLLVWPWDGGSSTESITPVDYDPTTNVWQALAAPPVEPRQDAASVWTGTEWIVWGGHNGETELADGAAFTPATASWRVLAPSPLAARHTRAVWTGNEMIVAAGASGPDSAPFAFSDGAAYNPRADTWRPTSHGPAHPGFAPVWTGKVLLAFFKNYEFTYDPATDRWAQGPANDQAGFSHFPVWTGNEGLVLGGTNGTGGAAYTPPP